MGLGPVRPSTVARWLPWAICLALILALVILAGIADHRKATLEAVDRAAETYRLDVADAVVARQASDAMLARALDENDALKAAAARVATVAPRSGIIGTISHRGTPVSVPCPPTPSPAGAVEAERTPPAHAPAPASFRCDTDLLAAKTKAGNVIVDGETRLIEEPDTVLVVDRWTHGTTVAWVPEIAKPPVKLLRGWGLAGAVIVESDGLRPGLGVATPEWAPKLGRWQPSVGAIGTVHAGSVYVAAVVRF